MQLERYVVHSIHVEAQADIEVLCDFDGEPELTWDFNLLEHRHEKKHRVFLSLAIDWPMEKQVPFQRIGIELEGIFSFPANTANEQIQKYVPLLCLLNLFGLARALLSQNTSHCPNGAYLLPLLDLPQMLKDKKAEKTTEIDESPNATVNDSGGQED
jgi:preprotein translocase subunit SecB